MAIGGVSSSYLNNLNRINSQYNSTLQKIATGSNIPSAKYSPSTYAISQRMQSNIGALSQSHQNVQNSNSLMKTAEGAVSNTISSLRDIKASLINAANDTNTGSDRTDINKAISSAVRTIDDNAHVQYNGMTLLDGSQSTNVNAAVGSGDTNLHLGNMTAESLGLVDSEGNLLIDANAENIEDSIARVDSALETATAQQSNIQSSLEDSLDQITSIGAQEAALDFKADNIMTMEENQIASESTLADADIAKLASDLKNQDTLQQVAVFALQAQNQNRSNVLQLLQ